MFDEDENDAFDTIDRLFSDKPMAETQDNLGSRGDSKKEVEENLYMESKPAEEAKEPPAYIARDALGGYDDSKERVSEVKEDRGGLEETTADKPPEEVLTVSDSGQKPLLMKTKPSYDNKIEKSKETDKADKMSDLDMLEGYAMALEWEFTDKDVKKFNYHLNRVAALYADNHNQILVKLLRAIVNYISGAQEKAVPETMSILSNILKTLKMVNSGDKDKSFIKVKIQEAYQEVLNLKKHISSYNKKFNKEKEEEVISKEPTVSIQPPQESIPQGILSRLDEYEKRISYLEEQNKKLKNIIIGL